jgi:hypothetical protein
MTFEIFLTTCVFVIIFVSIYSHDEKKTNGSMKGVNVKFNKYVSQALQGRRKQGRVQGHRQDFFGRTAAADP